MAATFTVKLLQGATEITSWTQELTASLATYERALTQGEKDAITDWRALRMSFVAYDDQAQVAWAELEAPAASLGGSPTPSASASPSLSGSASPSGSASSSYSGSASPSGSASASPDNPTFEVDLYCGAALVGSYTIDITSTLETYSHVLTAEEYARVTDWATLSLVFRADGRQAKVSWAELESGIYAGSGSESGSPSQSRSGSESSSYSPSASQSGSESSSPSSGPASVTLTLYQGAGFIASRDVVFTETLATYSFDLTPVERAGITDWSALRLAVTADVDQVAVSWLALQAPVAASGGSPSPSGSPSGSASGSRSSSASSSASGSPSRSASGSASGSTSASGSGSASGSASSTPSQSSTPSSSPSGSRSGSESASGSASTSGSPSPSPSGSPSRSSSPSTSGSGSASPSGSESASAGDYQRGLPATDISVGNWTDKDGGTTNLAASIGETPRDDGTYIKSAVVPVDDTCKIKLSVILSPDVGTVTMRIAGRWR